MTLKTILRKPIEPRDHSADMLNLVPPTSGLRKKCFDEAVRNFNRIDTNSIEASMWYELAECAVHTRTFEWLKEVEACLGLLRALGEDISVLSSPIQEIGETE